jgi:hypothetical protein
MNILILDIENSPNVSYTWDQWNVKYISADAMIKPKEVMCFAAKWHGSDQPAEFWSAYPPVYEPAWRYHKEEMYEHAWELLNEADAVVHYNGRTHDIPHLNTGFLQRDWNPPSPFKHIDLLDTVKKHFNFPYNTLDYVSRELGLGHKVEHEGMGLWVKCMKGDPVAWARMEEYNRGDVLLTEALYDRLRPWIAGHPSEGATTGQDGVCASCGAAELVREGYSYTKTGKYQRYSCRNCRAWLTDTKRMASTDIKEETR